MAKEYRLSAERLEELKQELTYLKTVREKEVAELIKEARSFGDLSENSEEEESYQVVGSQEADPMNGRISEDSPFGRALLGKKAGEEVVVEAPAGNIRYQIVEIQR